MKRSNMKSFLPEEITIQILSRMPAISLIRLKALSKHYSAIITSPNFISTHLHHSNPEFFLLRAMRGRYNEAAYGISLIANETTTTEQDMSSFLEDKMGSNFKFNIVGSSNGLVCVNFCPDGIHNILWNPATREYRFLPAPLIPLPEIHHDVVLGFGCFHCETNDDDDDNDYTLVHIVQNYTKEFGVITKAEVFTLSTVSWREIKEFDIRFNCTWFDSVVVNGVWYKVLYDPWERENLFILCFDLHDESFCKILLPKCGQCGRPNCV